MSEAGVIEILARGVCVVGGSLLLCRTKGASNTYLPGGHVEFGERAVDALTREIDEELGVGAKVGKFLGAVEHRFMQKGEQHCEINLVFEMEIESLSSDEKPVAAEDYIEFEWCEMGAMADARVEPARLCDDLNLWLGSDGASWASWEEESA